MSTFVLGGSFLRDRLISQSHGDPEVAGIARVKQEQGEGLARLRTLEAERRFRENQLKLERQQSQKALQQALSKLDNSGVNNEDEKIEEYAIKTADPLLRIQFLLEIIEGRLENAVALITDDPPQPSEGEVYRQKFEHHKCINAAYVQEIRRVLTQKVDVMDGCMRDLSKDMTPQQALTYIRDTARETFNTLSPLRSSYGYGYIPYSSISDLLKIMTKLEDPQGDLHITKQLLAVRNFGWQVEPEVVEQMIRYGQGGMLDLIWKDISFYDMDRLVDYTLEYNIGMMLMLVHHKELASTFLKKAIERRNKRKIELVIQHINISPGVFGPVFANNHMGAFIMLIRKMKNGGQGMNVKGQYVYTLLDSFLYNLRDPIMLQLLVNEGARVSSGEIIFSGHYAEIPTLVRELIRERELLGIDNTEVLRLAINSEFDQEARDIIFDELGHLPLQVEKRFSEEYLNERGESRYFQVRYAHMRPKILQAEVEYREALHTLLKYHTPMSVDTVPLVEGYLLPEESEEVKALRSRKE